MKTKSCHFSLEERSKREKNRSAHIYQLEKGIWPGQTPPGYKKICSRVEWRKRNNARFVTPVPLEIDTSRAPLIQEIFTLYGTGEFTYRTLSKHLQEKYKDSLHDLKLNLGKTWINTVLNNPFYMGIMKKYGKLYPHNHPTLITKELWERVEYVKRKKKQLKNNGSSNYYISPKSPKRPLKNWEKLKMERGETQGDVPFGYYREYSNKEWKKKNGSKYSIPQPVLVDGQKSLIIQDAFKTYASGEYSLFRLYQYLNNKYENSISHISVLARILCNKFYVGIATWASHEYKHKHSQLISQELFDQVQKVKEYQFVNKASKKLYAQEYGTWTGSSSKEKNNKSIFPPSPFTLDHVMQHFNYSLAEAQGFTLEQELEGNIEQVGPNTWKEIDAGNTESTQAVSKL